MNLPKNNTRYKTYSKPQHRNVMLVKEPAQLMQFLMDSMPGKSRNSVKSILRHRQVMVGNAVVTRHDHQLKPGQQVAVSKKSIEERPLPPGIRIMFEDKFILVVEKEAGLLSVAAGSKKETTVQSILSEHVKNTRQNYKVFPVHRLDRATSGVMIFAKNIRLQHEIRDNWLRMVTKRTYIAVVEGPVKKNQDTIITWLKEGDDKNMYSTRDSIHGKKAITHYKVIQRTSEFSMLEVELETGRKNQIRVHMQDIGNSVVGDDKYGSKTNPFNRLGLHALNLSFKHPVSGEMMSFESRIPNVFYKPFRKKS